MRFAHIEGPKGWSGEHTKRSAVRNRRPQSGWRREDTPKRRPQRRNTAPPKARAVRSAGTLGRRRRGARRPRAVRETGRWRRSPEGVKGRGQREALRSPGIPGQRSAGAHGGRRQWRKQAVVSPMKQGEPQASLRAQWNDHAELRVGAKQKNTFPPRLLAVEAREAVRRQAIGKSRPQTAGLWAISPSGQCCSPGGFLCAFAAKNSLASRGLCGIINAKYTFLMEG